MDNESGNSGNGDIPGPGNLAEDVQEHAEQLARRLPFAGHAAWLMMRSQPHRMMFLQDLEWRVFPPLLLEQCKLYFDNKAGQLPVAFVSWARLSDEAERDYVASQRIAPGAWNSGEHLWLVDFVAPFGATRAVLSDIHGGVLQGREVKLLYPGPDGKVGPVRLADLVTPPTVGPGDDDGRNRAH